MEGFVLKDVPRDGAENMALDGAMLSLAAELGQPILRFYQWKKPTVSLGYFQRLEDYRQNAAAAADNVVRRSTGGGAIIHHHDWTYSIAVPDRLLGQLRIRMLQGCGAGTYEEAPSTKPVGASQSLYHAMHDAVVGWLGKQSIAATKHIPSAAHGSAKDEPFLCFQRRAEGDVVVQGSKVMGSAQRRGKAALLQHGSLLLATSEYAPELPGLQELADVESCEVAFAEFVSQLTHAASVGLGVQFQPIETSDTVRFRNSNHIWEALLASNADRRFEDFRWTEKR